MAFLFESSKDKELKKTVEDRYYEAVSHENKYEANKNILVGYCNSSNKKAIERMVDLIKANIKDEEISPRQKYFSMLLLRDVMTTRNKALGNYVVKKILQRLSILARFNKESNDPARAKEIFGKQKKTEQQNFAVRFHNLLLECLVDWGTNWPKGSDGPANAFKQNLEQLYLDKVSMPAPKAPVRITQDKNPPIEKPPSREQLMETERQQAQSRNPQGMHPREEQPQQIPVRQPPQGQPPRSPPPAAEPQIQYEPPRFQPPRYQQISGAQQQYQQVPYPSAPREAQVPRKQKPPTQRPPDAPRQAQPTRLVDPPRAAAPRDPSAQMEEINKFLEGVHANFIFLEEMVVEPEADILKEIVTNIEKDLAKGDGHISYLLSLNTDQAEAIINLITDDFELLEKIKKDIKVIENKPNKKPVFRDKYLKLLKIRDKKLKALLNSSREPPRRERQPDYEEKPLPVPPAPSYEQEYQYEPQGYQNPQQNQSKAKQQNDDKDENGQKQNNSEMYGQKQNQSDYYGTSNKGFQEPKQENSQEAHHGVFIGGSATYEEAVRKKQTEERYDEGPPRVPTPPLPEGHPRDNPGVPNPFFSEPEPAAESNQNFGQFGEFYPTKEVGGSNHEFMQFEANPKKHQEDQNFFGATVSNTNQNQNQNQNDFFAEAEEPKRQSGPAFDNTAFNEQPKMSNVGEDYFGQAMKQREQQGVPADRASFGQFASNFKGQLDSNPFDGHTEQDEQFTNPFNSVGKSEPKNFFQSGKDEITEVPEAQVSVPVAPPVNELPPSGMEPSNPFMTEEANTSQTGIKFKANPFETTEHDISISNPFERSKTMEITNPFEQTVLSDRGVANPLDYSKIAGKEKENPFESDTSSIHSKDNREIQKEPDNAFNFASNFRGRLDSHYSATTEQKIDDVFQAPSRKDSFKEFKEIEQKIGHTKEEFLNIFSKKPSGPLQEMPAPKPPVNEDLDFFNFKKRTSTSQFDPGEADKPNDFFEQVPKQDAKKPQQQEPKESPKGFHFEEFNQFQSVNQQNTQNFFNSNDSNGFFGKVPTQPHQEPQEFDFKQRDSVSSEEGKQEEQGFGSVRPQEAVPQNPLQSPVQPDSIAANFMLDSAKLDPTNPANNPFGNPLILDQSLAEKPSPLGVGETIELNLEDFTAVRKIGIPWNPFSKKPAAAPPAKNELLLKMQVDKLTRAAEGQRKEFEDQRQLHVARTADFLAVRTEYLERLTKIQDARKQKAEFARLATKAEEDNSRTERLIAEENEKIRKLKEMKEAKNDILRRLFECKVKRKIGQSKRTDRTSAANKFAAFNETAKHLHTMVSAGSVAGSRSLRTDSYRNTRTRF